MIQQTLDFRLTSPETRERPDPLRERRKAMAAAFKAANEDWRAGYEQFVLDWLGRYGPGTAEEIRLAYEKDKSRPQIHGSKRASGAIFARLRRRGRIREVGKRRSALYGNDLSVCELVTE